MSKSPFITILTASLNSGFTIKKTLESVRSQTFQDMEHIVIDGGSKDETCDILREFEDAYELFWISEPDQGIAHALNKGLKRSNARYVLVIHADDQLLGPDILTRVCPFLKRDLFDINGFPVVLEHPTNGRVLLKPKRVIWWHHFKTIFLHQGTFVHKRVFDRMGGFREQFSIALDYDFFYRALMSRSTIKFGNQPIALMGGKGVSSAPELLYKRLREEALVQRSNEKNLFWRIAQLLFQRLYFPYKTRLAPRLSIQPK